MVEASTAAIISTISGHDAFSQYDRKFSTMATGLICYWRLMMPAPISGRCRLYESL